MNQEIEMLLGRWNYLSVPAAVEKHYRQQIELAKQNKIRIPTKPDILASLPIKQIDIIRKRIKTLLPEWERYDEDCQIVNGLYGQDLIDVYVQHQKISIQKIRALISSSGHAP